MPIISTIGRRSLRVRLLIFTIYALLAAGATTMIYPFLLMLSGSTKSSVDSPTANMIPSFMVNETDLYRKYVEALFNEHLEVAKNVYQSESPSFRTLEPPANPHAGLVAAWSEFLNETELPPYTYTIGYIEAPVTRGVFPSHLRGFKRQMIDNFDDDIVAMNLAMQTDFVSWNAFALRREEYQQRRNKILNAPYNQAFNEFKAKQPLEERYYYSIEGFYRNQYLKSQYTVDIEVYNQEHSTDYANWQEVHLDRRLPEGPGRTDLERQDWQDFARSIVSLLWLRMDADIAPVYEEYITKKYGDIAQFNLSYGTGYTAFGQVPFPSVCPTDGPGASDWETFLQGWEDDAGTLYMAPAAALYIHSVDFLFRDYLQKRYGSLQGINQSLSLEVGDWLEFLPPQQDWHYLAFREKTATLRWEFLTRNFITVIEYLALHGRGIYNTVVYCTLAVLSALIINPVAAYALSRYKPPSAYKVLLFLMLTMAFPPMVTQIPIFLMLREFALLNTFWALILPGLANGYAIFLLKGFFDSLPRELYESAQIDGAGEFRIFWQITMSLSQPILAVIALQAFTTAYSNFMMALLICQDESMWTMMPWLYQLQQRSGEGVIFASLIVAAFPTFIIFVFAQNIIMRGIVVPVEK
jgi:ABC-type glycerol-3-phosphate transport system permease component